MVETKGNNAYDRDPVGDALDVLFLVMSRTMHGGDTHAKTAQVQRIAPGPTFVFFLYCMLGNQCKLRC